MVAYPFVAAMYYTPGGLIEARALVIHMAEGGGTVQWLTHPSGDNSADFVIEYSGAVTQMVRDADYSHSLHWDLAHLSAPDCGVFDPAGASRLLGIPTTTGPLPYIKAVEIEGFAATGPNAAQVAALEDLIAECRRRWPAMRGLLGHRDFMGYKACPGCHVFDKVAHGAFPAPEADMAISTTGLTLTSLHAITLPPNTAIYERPAADATILGRQGGPVSYFGTPAPGWKAVRVDIGGTKIAYTNTAAQAYALTPAPAPDCAAAVADERLRWTTWLTNAPG